MKKRFVLALSAFLIAAVFLMGSVSSAEIVSPEDAAVLSAAVAGENELMKIGVVPGDTICRQLKTQRGSADINVEEAAKLAEKVPTAFEDYYTEGLAAKYTGIADASDTVLYDSSARTFDLAVDSGTTQSQLIYVEDLSETEKRIKFSCVGWLTSIFERGGKYTVRVIFNRDTLEKTMVKENGQWKVQSMESDSKEFAPDSYEPDQGAFDTLEEALQKVHNTNITMLNPYKFS